MGLLGLRVNQQDDYLALLQRDPVKCELLAKDLLINVTNFFRDPDMFETLTEKVVPEIIAGLEPDAVLRVWVAGCSTGEEAYSLAMVCREAITASGRDIKLQIFASDLDADAIAHARAGIYPRDIAASVPAARLERFFIDEGTGYRVTPALRGVIVFSVQDVLADPPFSRIDLISCRNLLIYFNQEAQAKAIALFHFALRPAGILVLGSAESIGKGESRFEAVPGAECCFRHVASTRPIESGQFFTFAERLLPNKSAGLPPPSTRQANLAEVCRNAVLATHAPAAVLVNRHYECLYSMGPTER